MNSKNYLIAEAIISILFGIALFIMPDQFLQGYMNEGDSLGAVARAVARAYGGILFGAGIIAWQNRHAQGAVRKSLLTGFLVIALTGGISSLIELIPGNVSSMGWSTVGICVFLAIWALLLLFQKEKQA